MKTKGREMKLKKKDWKTWDVQGIPPGVLDRMVAIPHFDVNIVKLAAQSHLERVLLAYALRGIRGFHPAIYKASLKQILQTSLANLDPDPKSDSIFSLGEILEYAFIVNKLERSLDAYLPGYKVP
jgi:hypothetical protein